MSSTLRTDTEKAVQVNDAPVKDDDGKLDEAYDIHRRFENVEIPAEEYKSVLRKIDLRVLPVLFMVYLLQYLDKNALNFAEAYGLEEALHMSSSDYSWLNSIFYFGYLIAQYPSSWAMQRLPTGKFLSATTLAWGIIMITTPACKNFGGIAVNRFLLGVTEAPINPGFVLVMSLFYTAQEQPLRLETYYCTNGIATMFGGLIGYAVGHINSKLQRWMWVFLFFGAASLIMSVLSLVFLPDSPATARFLDDRERAIAVKRVTAGRGGMKNKHFKKYQAVQAFKDPKTWMLFVMAVAAQVPNAALTSFGSLILKSFGFDTLETQYMQIPGGAVQFLALIFGGVFCSWFPNTRCIVMCVANTICIAGAAMLVGLPESNLWGRLVGLWLCYFQGLGFSISLTMVSSNIAGYTKKQVTGAALFVGYCVGNIIGPQTFKKTASGGYGPAYIAMLVGYTVKLLMVVLLYIYMYRSNKARDEEAALLMASSVSASETSLGAKIAAQGIEEGLQDRTELENKAFRYTL